MSQFHNFQSALSVAEKREPRMEPHVRVKHIMRLTLRATFFERFVSKPFCLKRNYAPSPSGGMHIHHTHISALSKFALRPDRAMSCVSVTIWRREYCISLRALADQRMDPSIVQNAVGSLDRWNGERYGPPRGHDVSTLWLALSRSDKEPLLSTDFAMCYSTVSTAKMCYPCVYALRIGPEIAAKVVGRESVHCILGIRMVILSLHRLRLTQACDSWSV
ncbi:hypothetical protein KCU68_g84, partial [Aureobasidium melanogenum]